jgi:hypothetical protein
MRWTQHGRAGDHIARPFSQDGPWNRIIPADATYTTIGTGWAGLDWGLQSWSGDFYSVTPYQATTSDPLFNVRYYDTWWNVSQGTWTRTGNTLTTENSIISASSTSFPFDMNPYSTTVATNPATRTAPPAGTYNAFANPGTLPFQVRVPAAATPSPGLDGHWVIVQPDGSVFECYGGIKVTQAQNAVVCTRYMTFDPTLQGDGWVNGLTASMISVMAGVLRNAEIDFTWNVAVTIPHAMKIAVPGNYLSTAAPAYPALAFDISALTNNPAYNGTDAVPMGSRLAIPYSTSIEGRGTYLTGLGRAIAVAAQRYGFIVTDRGGSGLTVFNERFPTANHLLNWDNGVWTDVNWVLDNIRRVTSPV